LLEDGDLHGSLVLAMAAHDAAEYERGLRSAVARRRSAIHEAGHAVVGLALGWAPTLATLRPEYGAGTRASVQFQSGFPHGEARAAVSYAGESAMRLAGFPYDPDPCSADFQLAAETLRRSRGDLSESEERALLAFCRTRSMELTRRHWPAVEAVAKALVEHETLDGAMISQAASAAMPTAAWPTASEAA
jgi:ATP-dependent Zn protease